ncbi:carbohydrate kinase family protein [Mangrovactinospora gilvigrisea]|uniref:Carbohydrate kinase family protein n=1 Tax=Mangrovactinospora gilvigrisea TaxID=1428644 RepID=A0A1J7C1A1_9ACTN|nr:PfkB family carbohydrate kinase [Mangrovactinospora gilvigrisea]OIV35344.1 carbohydrate kinase family protein [Mangrovactinospora gilvigrisea]
MSTATPAPRNAADAAADPLAKVRNPGDPSQPEHDVFLTGTVFLDIVMTGMDHAPVRGTESWARGMGSSPGGIANMAAATARLGLRTTLAAAFGEDVYGDYCWDALSRDEGVDLGPSRRWPGWHSPVTVSMAYEGERTMVTHEHPPPASPVPAEIPATRAVVTSFEPGRPVEWVSRAAGAGAKVFGDVGWDETDRWELAALPDLGHSHAFLPNAEEAQRYTRTDSPDAAARRLARIVPIVAVTRGAEGALAIDNLTGETAEVPGLPVDALDPTGAGDVFVAGFMTGTLAGWPLDQRLALANLCAALSVQHFGGSLAAPGWIEIAAWWQHLATCTRAACGGDPELRRRYGFLDELLPVLLPDGIPACAAGGSPHGRRRAVPTVGFRAA